MCNDNQLKASFAHVLVDFEDEHDTMTNPVTHICDLNRELPPDADAPQWLVDALQVPRGWANSDGCDVHYFRWGDPAIPLLLMHGFLAHALHGLHRPFLAEQYHVVAYDLSGMGDSVFVRPIPTLFAHRKWSTSLVKPVYLITPLSPS